MIAPNRHDRGWPKVEIKTFTVQMGQSWRFCIEPMGYRDAIWERGGYVELIIWKKHTDPIYRPHEQLCVSSK